MSNEFTPGDRVRHKTGKPHMVVLKVDQKTSSASCHRCDDEGNQIVEGWPLCVLEMDEPVRLSDIQKDTR